MPITVVTAGLVDSLPGAVPVTRHDPVETVGQVRVFAPTAGCRGYRLRWTEPDGSPVGTDPAAAIAKATVLDRRLARAAGSAAMIPLGEIATEYLEHGCSPYTDRTAG